MPALQTVRRVLGAAKPLPSVEAAERKHADAQAELERVDAAGADSVAKAREAYHADPSDVLADALIKAERRAELHARRHREVVALAHAELLAVRKRSRDARLAELDATVAGTGEAMRQLARRGEDAVATLLSIADERDEVLATARAAALEAKALRLEAGEDAELVSQHTQATLAGLASKPAALRHALRSDVVGLGRARHFMSLFEDR